MEQLDNAVRPYAWGSRTVIAELLGEPVPSPHPQAEMWLGAHPANPSTLIQPDGSRLSLLEAMAAEPDQLLGPVRARRWDNTLPFLLKVLAADEPLSLQAHPSLEQAGAGFAREEAVGLPRDAANRNYRDANHKPELICALTEFHALVGFREPADTVRLLRALDVPELAGHTELLAARAERRRAARAVHHVDHPAAERARHPGARPAGRLRPAGRRRRRVPGRGAHRAGAVRALPGGRRRAGRAAAQPGHAGPGGGVVPARGQPARLPVRRGRRADGQLGQRAARRAHPQARGRPGAAAGARLHRGDPAGEPRPAGRRLGPLRHPGRRSSCSAAGTPPRRPAPARTGRPTTSRCPTADRASCSARPARRACARPTAS